jgi:hypothetical protein
VELGRFVDGGEDERRRDPSPGRGVAAARPAVRAGDGGGDEARPQQGEDGEQGRDVAFPPHVEDARQTEDPIVVAEHVEKAEPEMPGGAPRCRRSATERTAGGRS